MTHGADILVRAGTIALALVLWFWTQRRIGSKPAPRQGIGDGLHDATAGANAWLHANPRAASLTLVATSGLIDLFGLYLIGATLLGPTVRPFAALLGVFALRQGCQALCTLPSPKGVIWRHPGFPSLFVTYGVSNDFFFSGHTAIAVVGALEVGRAGPAWLAAVAALVAVIEAATVIVLRAHYLMDILTAVFVAWGCDEAAARAAPHLDSWLRSLG